MSTESTQFDNVRDAVLRTKEWYQQRDRDTTLSDMYAPFQEVSVNHRCQQYRYLARLLRGKGIVSLEKMRVLDVGCGDGQHVRAFLDYGADPNLVCGIEIRESTPELMKRLSPHLRLVMFDGITIPFAEGEFDLVTQHLVVTSILSPELRRRMTAEMWRVVAPGGFLFWWDLLECQGPTAHERGQRIDLDDYFAGLPREEYKVPRMPSPDECLGAVPGARLLRPLLRMLAQKPAFCAALIGPK
jgi:SAM-dependent methyltransferase